MSDSEQADRERIATLKAMEAEQIRKFWSAMRADYPAIDEWLRAREAAKENRGSK